MPPTWVANPLVLAQSRMEIVQTWREEVRVVVVLRGKGVRKEPAIPCIQQEVPLDPLELPLDCLLQTDLLANSAHPLGLEATMVNSPLENFLDLQHQVMLKD